MKFSKSAKKKLLNFALVHNRLDWRTTIAVRESKCYSCYHDESISVITPWLTHLIKRKPHLRLVIVVPHWFWAKIIYKKERQQRVWFWKNQEADSDSQRRSSISFSFPHQHNP